LERGQYLLKYNNQREPLIGFLFVLLISSTLILLKLHWGELIGPDCPAHVLTGVFISDFIKDHAFLLNKNQMSNYIWEYYAHYSNIGLIHWPPFFHILEGLYFSVVKFTPVSARLFIYGFFLVGLFFYYKLLLQMYNLYVAVLGGVIFIASPLVLINSRTVSLEIPSLSLCIISIYFYYSYLNSEKTKDVILTAVFTALALLTKQTAVFLLPLFASYYIYMVFLKKAVQLNIKHLLIFISLVAILALPYYIVAFYFQGSTIMKDVLRGTVYHNPFQTIGNYVFYIKTLPNQVNLLTIIFLCWFIVLAIMDYDQTITRENVFVLFWLVTCFVLFTIIAQKEIRYIIYWVPALAGLAAFAAIRTVEIIRHRWMTKHTTSIIVISVIILSMANVAMALTVKQPYLKGYDNVAQYLTKITAKERQQIIFFDGYDHGHMGVSLRLNDPRRRLFIFRSSKFLYAAAIMPSYECWNIRENKEDIEKFFKKYGIRYILLSYCIRREIPAIRALRELVHHNPQFELIKTFPIDNNTVVGNGTVELYFYKGVGKSAETRKLEIPMPNLHRTITITLH
jgi:hypothetical protein